MIFRHFFAHGRARAVVAAGSILLLAIGGGSLSSAQTAHARAGDGSTIGERVTRIAGSTIGERVTRIAGEDRYAVSANVSSQSFDPGTQYAFIASGETFPDALSAGAALGNRGPVLLVTRDDIPHSIQSELRRLRPTSIVIVGGANSVSAAVETALAEFGPVTRIGGADRYDVSAALSAKLFQGTFVATIYVASGEVYPDALSASAAVGGAGPVLLVTKDGIPSAIARELGRHETFEIVVVGGPSTISDATFAAISRYAKPPTRVARLLGADRFEVSARISQFNRPTGSRTVYVASGSVFSDALSGSPAAADQLAPVLLVGRDVVPPAVKTELDRLNPAHIVVLGGPRTVSDDVMRQLDGYVVP
jgi:putative cell wall-binding protein